MMQRRGFLASMLALGAAPALALQGRFRPAVPGLRELRGLYVRCALTPALLRIYTGAPGRAGRLLFEAPLDGPSSWAADSGLVFSPVSGPVLATGWARSFAVERDGQKLAYGRVGRGPKNDIRLDAAALVSGQVLSFTGLQLKMGAA